MGKSLAECEWENKTRLLFFKHRGNVAEIVKELREIYSGVENTNERFSVEFVTKVIDKFKRQQKVNDPYIAVFIMDYIFMGTHQREVLWDADNTELNQYKFLYRSACCDKAVESQESSEGLVFVCLKCRRICNVYRVPNLDVFEMKRRIRVEQREDEAQIVKSASDLGLIGEKVPVIKETHYHLESSRSKQLTEGDRRIVDEVKQLPPMDREAVIGRLQKQLRETQQEESENK